MSFEVGARVDTEKGKGTVAFIGTTDFAPGEWVGIILDEPKGKNNGEVQGRAYFTCEDNYGIMIRAAQVKLEPSGPRTRSMATGLKAPTSALRSNNPAKSPGGSPKMSPAASKENIAKATPAGRKPSSSSKLSELAHERNKPTTKSALAKEPAQPKMTRENSNLSAKNMTRENSNLSSKAISKENLSSKVISKDNLTTRNVSPLPEPEKQQPVSNLVKKVEEKQAAPPSTPIHHQPPMSFEDSTQAERYKVEIRDLEEKLETLRMKRREDQQRIKELEVESQKVQSLYQLRTKMAEENKDLMRQIEEAKREVIELREWKNIHQEQFSNSAAELEMITMDKEMAEEKADMLERDNEYLKEQIEELKTNLQILQEEMATAGTGGAAPVGNSIQMKQVEANNEKLKLAVVKLRDLHDAANAAKIEAEKKLAEKEMEINEIMDAAEIYKKQAEESEKRIYEYQEQAEAALGAEEMVTILTSKNMEMEEIIAQLESEKEELEAIHDMDEQLTETQKEIERDLRKDMEGLHTKIRELVQKLLAEEKHNDDLMKTIIKFREKTHALNEQIQDRDDQILRYEHTLNGQMSEEKNAASLALQQQVNANKNFLEAVERHLNGIELEYARKQIGYVKAFLPDNFTKAGGDSDCVMLNILFPRIVAKAQVFPKLVSDKFPPVPGGIRREHITKSHKAEQWGQVIKVSYLCSSLSTVCAQFESAVQKMSVESLVRLAQMQPEISAHEKSLDSYIDLLKQGRFDENTSLDSLKKAINYFLSSISVNVGYEGFSYQTYHQNLVKQMIAAVNWMRISAQRIAFSLTLASEHSDVQQFATKLNSEIEQCEQLILRISKAIPENKQFKVQQQVLEEAQSVILMIERLAYLLHDISTVAGVQVSMNTETDGLDASRLKEIIHGSVEKTFGSTSMDKVYEPVDKHFLGLRSSLSEILNVFENGDYTEEPENKTTVYAPMLERAHLRKQAASEAEGLRWQLDKKDAEIQELRKTVKSKVEDISSYKLRLEMADARMNSSGQQVSVKVKSLEDKLEQLNIELSRQKNDFEQIHETLKNEIKDLQRENDELKKVKTNMSKMALFQSIQGVQTQAAAASSPSKSSPTTPESIATRAEMQLLGLSLEESQRNLRAANMEIIRLRSENSIQGIACELPNIVCGPETLRASKTNYLLDVLCKEAEQLKKEELKYSVFIPDISKPLHVQKEEREKFQEARERVAERVSAVRARLHRYWATENPGVPFPSKFKIDRRPETTAAQQIKFNSEAFHKILNKWGTVQ